MGSRRTVALIAAASVVLGVAPVSSVGACSMAPAPALDELMLGEPVDGMEPDVVRGVYEYEHIARSPGILGDRSVTVVTRYWGLPPDDLGLRGVTSGCGSHADDVGTIGYWWVTANSTQWRSSLSLRGLGGPIDAPLDATNEALLRERFGPPTVIATSSADRLVAVMSAWRWELVAFAAAAGIAAALAGRRRATDQNSGNRSGIVVSDFRS